MESNKQHFRPILLFYYKKGKNPVQARKKLTNMYGEDVLTVRQYASRSGSPVEADKNTIKVLVDANWRITTREIDERFSTGLTSKLDIWVPHVFTDRNLCRRVDVCDSLLKRHENDPFLKRTITKNGLYIKCQTQEIMEQKR
ncbi:histone-lysine N-methyltransferase SETMAR-like [Vespa mandarinia]|uniref:histone-lysine N-methyltransferase SETMAR-like n=1 Tax=Vespa mandarinia TaxID=7446 RepID=UPI00160B6BE9|nr:histone-lysine N-methyltransferase SETMAR-like [Vespa mandarinia]